MNCTYDYNKRTWAQQPWTV